MCHDSIPHAESYQPYFGTIYVLLIIYVPMLTLSPSVKGLWINGECSHGIKHALNFPYVASNVIKK